MWAHRDSGLPRAIGRTPAGRKRRGARVVAINGDRHTPPCVRALTRPIQRDGRIAPLEAEDNPNMCPIWEDEVLDVGGGFLDYGRGLGAR
jgi:hypothetical protein